LPKFLTGFELVVRIKTHCGTEFQAERQKPEVDFRPKAHRTIPIESPTKAKRLLRAESTHCGNDASRGRLRHLRGGAVVVPTSLVPPEFPLNPALGPNAGNLWRRGQLNTRDIWEIDMLRAAIQ
jgi:hypothetical protein